MTTNGKTYAIGDLFTTQRSNVTGTITEIIPVNERTTRVKLLTDEGSRWTSVTIKQISVNCRKDLSKSIKTAQQTQQTKKRKGKLK